MRNSQKNAATTAVTAITHDRKASVREDCMIAIKAARLASHILLAVGWERFTWGFIYATPWRLYR
jgi:hypothetical protein